jgi:uncharacterized protein YcbK (DUF882 family)
MDFFTEEEKRCPCCGLNLVDRNNDFLRALNSARDLYGRPMEATSMTRCPEHNAAVGGARGSAHMDGRAADIRCSDPEDRVNMVKCFLAAGFRRIEISGVHIHVDMKKGARDVLLLKTERGLV